MKTFLILAFFALAASAFALEESERVNGENGWYVPQLDGSFEWMDMDVAEEWLNAHEELESRGLVTTNPVNFYLYTAKNPTSSKHIYATTKSIGASNFNAANPTRFVIHGWTQSNIAGMNKSIRKAFLSKGDYNVIVVDWARARAEYATAVLAVAGTGKKVAAMVNFLKDNYGMSLNDLYIIGHSLGAHVAGYAGKNTDGQVHTIVGLDPALPLFSYNSPNKRLNSNDAWYVESIQTNGGKLGFLQPIGKGAFYPNGGKSQPGCGLDATGACSHGRSTTYYAEAITQDNFGTIKCGDYEAAVAKECGSTYSNVRMGADTNAYMVAGDFYVPVNKKAPFGMIN